MKRHQEEDFSKQFEDQPASVQSSKSGLFGMIGGALLGAVGASFLLSGKPKAQKKRRPVEPEVRRQENESKLEELLQKQNDAMDRMSTQLANLQFAIEKIKRENIEEERKEELDDCEETDPEAAFEAFVQNCESEDVKTSALKNLRMWLNNVSKNPDIKNRGRINVTNPNFKAQFASNLATPDLLRSAGFTQNENFWEFNSSNTGKLQKLLSIVQRAISASGPVFSKAEPWKIMNMSNGNKEQPQAKDTQSSLRKSDLPPCEANKEVDTESSDALPNGSVEVPRISVDSSKEVVSTSTDGEINQRDLEIPKEPVELGSIQQENQGILNSN